LKNCKEMKIIEISEAFDEFHFLDSQFDRVCRLSNNLLIPAINIGRWKGGLSSNKRLDYIRCCMLCFYGVEATAIDNVYFEVTKPLNKKTRAFSFSGTFLTERRSVKYDYRASKTPIVTEKIKLISESVTYEFQAYKASLIIEKLELSNRPWPVDRAYLAKMGEQLFKVVRGNSKQLLNDFL